MRLSEIYTSIQGEGPNVGKPIQFVRFGGCNMRCPGWPCDTQYAIQPEFRHEWEVLKVGDILTRIQPWPKHVCITGGEPLIQMKSEMHELGMELLSNGYSIDMFTNGSQPFPKWVDDSLGRSHSVGPPVTIVMDWKLPGSGEEFSGIAQRRDNLAQLTIFDAVKFVVTNKEDLLAARDIYHQWGQPDEFRTYVGAAWGHISDQEIIDFMTLNELPWYLNVQVHKYIWEPTLRGV